MAETTRGAAPGSHDGLPGYYETGKGGAQHFTDLAIIESDKHGQRPTPEEVVAPEPLKRVKVLPPYQVCHEGIRHFPGEIAEVPESLAEQWIRSQWVVSDDQPEVVESPSPDPQPRRRGARK
jgi:hypothetical protein